MTTSGDPHRPDRREGAAGRPRAAGGARRAAGPDEPTVAMPGVTPEATEWGTRMPGGPAGATAYSADSPELFPPLPEPGPRRPPTPGPAPPAGAARHPGAVPPPFAWPDDRSGAPGGTVARAAGGAGGDPGGWRKGPGGPPPGHPGPWQPAPRRSTAVATAALVLGVASLLLLPVCGIGVLVAVAGLIVGIIAMARGTARGGALAGLALSVLTLLIAGAFAAWLASTGVTRCLDESLYPTRADVEACLEERLGVPITTG